MSSPSPPYLVPLIVASAFFMENMDASVISTSLPAIAADLGENALALKLALTAYLVSLAIFIPASGWLADRFGSRTVFAGAICVFMLGSILCAASSTLSTLVAARFVEGIGGAMMVPVGRLVLLRAVPKSGLIRALNVLTVAGLVAPVVGPPLGGFITQAFHWRWIFLINIPVGVVGLWFVLRHVPDIREDDIPPFDGRGFVISGLGLAVLMLGLSALGGHLLPDAITAACIGVGAALVLLYVIHARRTDHPVLNLALLRIPTFNQGVLVASLFRISIGATPFLLPLLFQLGFGLDPLHSGLLTCSIAIGAMFMKSLTSLTLRTYGFRRVLMVNSVVTSAAVAAAGFFTAGTPWFVIFAVLLVGGCLRSLQFTALNAITYADVPSKAMSQATGASSMSQRLFQSVGVVIGGLALQASSSLQGHEEIVAADFWPAFLLIALIAASSAFFHARLEPGAGAEVSGHRR